MAHNTFTAITDALKEAAQSFGKGEGSMVDKATKALKAIETEAKIGPALHEQVLGTIAQMKQKHGNLEKVLHDAYGYAVLPDVSKANLVLGAAYGIGEVFEKGRVVGYCAVVQLSLGIQVGGETFDELIVFHDEDTFKRFKGGKFAFAANAAIAVVKAKAEAQHGFGPGTSVYVISEGGLQIVTSIGAQKFIFRPAALGRTRTADQHTKAGQVPGAKDEERLESKGQGEAEEEAGTAKTKGEKERDSIH